MRTYAPIGQTPILRAWYTRDQWAAISAISPAGQVYFHSQYCAITSGDVIACLEHPMREGSGRMIIIWDGAPIHRGHLMHEFLPNGAAQWMHLERLPAYAPDLNPGEGIWQQLKGVELRNVCCCNLPLLWHELRSAVRRMRRKLRIIQGCFKGAGL